MNGPTKSAILSADASRYHGFSEYLKLLAAHHEAIVSQVNTSVQKPGGTYWDGATAEAGQGNTHSGWKATAHAEDIIERYRNSATPIIDHTLVPELANARNIIESVESQHDKGVSCSEDLKLSYNPVPGTSEKVAEENTKLVEARQKELTASANAWFAATQQIAQLVTAAQQDIDGVVNSAAGTFNINQVLRDTAPTRTTEGSTTKPDGYLGALRGQAAETADGATKPAGTPAGDTIDYKQVYPKDIPVGDKNVDPAKLGGVGAIPGVRDSASGREPPAKLAPALQAKDVPAFKEMTREKLTRMGVPADQIETQVNKAVESAQNPRLVRTDVPSASATDPKYIDRDFGEQFNRFTNGISDSATKTVDGQIEQAKILTGQAGPGAPGVAEAWKELGLGAVQQAHELTSDPLAAPKMGIEQAKDFYNNPSEFIGKNIIVGTEGLATGAIGGEAVAGTRGLLGDLTGTEGRALPHGLDDATPGHHTPPVEHPAPTVDHPTPTTGDHSGLNHVNTESGGTGAWNQELNKPAPDTHYNVNDRFQYATDDQSRVGHAHADLDASSAADRNGYQQRIAGGPDRLPGDEGGHIFGSQFGGPGEAINLTAMRDTLNSVGNREYYNLEGDWRTYIDQGKQVSVDVEITYPGDSRRPEMYSVKTYVDGKLDSVHSFRN